MLFEASKMLESRLFGFEAVVCVRATISQCSAGVKKCLVMERKERVACLEGTKLGSSFFNEFNQ